MYFAPESKKGKVKVKRKPKESKFKVRYMERNILTMLFHDRMDKLAKKNGVPGSKEYLAEHCKAEGKVRSALTEKVEELLQRTLNKKNAGDLSIEDKIQYIPLYFFSSLRNDLNFVQGSRKEV